MAVVGAPVVMRQSARSARCPARVSAARVGVAFADTPVLVVDEMLNPLRRDEAIARLDSLMRAQIFSIEDVLLLAKRFRGARGLKALRVALPLVDEVAASPRETWLRLLNIDAGLPRPTTQIPIVAGRGRLVRMADMGWEEFMVVSEYDGDQHRTNRRQYTKDVRSLRKARELGWIVDQVIKEDRPADILERAQAALVSRSWRPT